MKAVRHARAALATLAFATAAAHAGGPLGLCATGGVKYPGSGTVNLNHDGGGSLGNRSKAQADAIVVAAASKWTNVGTATLVLGRGPDLAADVTAGNYSAYLNRFSDGMNPVIYDHDGSIIDLILGTGAKGSVLGFAGSASSGCNYIEGQAVLNGAISISDATMTNVIAHELGHLVGLDHAQLDSTQGLSSSNYPLMYPIAYRSLQTLHEDDVAAISSLYPGPTVAATYGTLSGNFRLADGTTPVRGANIWARDAANPSRLYSSVSDYLTQGNGAFRMLLPPGTYTLHAEAISSDFDGGSSVGPHSDSYPQSPSFQAPLYVNGTPMSAKTLGNSSPTQLVITAGCAASAVFRIDGNGSIGGNCVAVTPPPPPPPPATSPPRLANLSTRGQVRTGNDVMIGGFIIGGSGAKTVVIRARGASLTAQGMSNVLSDPVLQLVRSSDQVTIAINDNWQAASNAAAVTASGFAPPAPLESAILATLTPGAYTAIVSGAGGTTGIGLIEVFEVDHPEVPLANISTRGQVLTGNDVMIGGFVIQGSGPQTVVIRARGPSLAQFGITNPLANPVLQLFSGQTQIASNDNWQTGASASQISLAGLAPSDPAEAAIRVTLNPGAYTAIVTGAGGTTGIGIVEVFAVP
jgi:hypothetical protein